jgi:hypothetical protein
MTKPVRSALTASQIKPKNSRLLCDKNVGESLRASHVAAGPVPRAAREVQQGAGAAEGGEREAARDNPAHRQQNRHREVRGRRLQRHREAAQRDQEDHQRGAQVREVQDRRAEAEVAGVRDPEEEAERGGDAEEATAESPRHGQLRGERVRIGARDHEQPPLLQKPSGKASNDP